MHDTEESARTFHALFQDEFSRTVRLAALLGADDPEDTAQEAFARLHQGWSRLRDEAAALTYLRRTTTNLTHSRTRHLGVIRRNAQRGRDAEGADGPLLAAERQAELIRAVKALPARQRQVLVLHYWSDLPVSEVAHVLEIPVGTVKSLLHRARTAIGRRLGDDDA